ncbi:MurR/RpiR family transcriptional regulator [Bacillus sp. Marseille-P3661]|uniref:MurR/RpiR family transcriptional regulator n=1 Tax=Bacillus sp. Marseille-P3661 TaxID=1936234 RepID=UPI000C83AB23|nr:MurR/RpiR family transcriptional regulator [Bacillus sp. Marseille-P3661]
MSNPPHVIQSIRALYHEFSEKEKLIADFILNNPKKIIHLTINQIAEDLEIADATVFRFCKRIGFKGYQAFKIALASEIVNPIEDIHETLQEEDSVYDVTDKVFKTNILAINETLKVMNSEKLAESVNLLLNARKIEFYGTGGSGIIAMDAFHKFIRTGINCMAYADTHIQLMAASQLTEKDVAVIISHSGSNKDIIDLVSVIKDSGAKTIGITNYTKSFLSTSVDIPLYTVSQETEYRTEALASRIAELSIIDALFVNVSKERKQEMKESLNKMRKAISLRRV